MSPDFLPGDFVIVWRWPWSKWQIGDDVLISHSRYGITIKRIYSIGKDGYSLTGLHPDSVTPTELGIQPDNAILGKVIYHIRKPRQR